MGLRLSLDSSESESNGGPTSTSRMYTSYHQPRDRTGARVSSEGSTSGSVPLDTHRNGSDPPTDSPPAHAADSISFSDLVRELRSMNPDDSALYRLFYPQSTRDPRTPSTPGAYRSNSMSNSVDPSQPNASRSGETTSTGRHSHTGRQRVGPSVGSGHHRHRTSYLALNVDGANRAQGRRTARRSEPTGANTAGHWDSSDSDADDFDFVTNLRLSSLLFRHLQPGSTSGRTSGPQVDHEFLRALRLSAARATYNVDRLTQNTGECTICLEDLAEGDVIARLQCLCVYHKKCIDSWFKRRPVCPVHPGDD